MAKPYCVTLLVEVEADCSERALEVALQQLENDGMAGCSSVEVEPQADWLRKGAV